MTFIDFLAQRGIPAPPISVWAFIPYWQVGNELVSEAYDTPQTRRELAEVFEELGLDWTWVPITTHNLCGTVEALLQSADGFTPLVLNYCDSDPVFGGPGIDVVQLLQRKGIAFTGAGEAFYSLSTSKILMKEAFVRAGVPTSPYALITGPGRDVEGLCERLGAPLFVKPVISAGSFGISVRSVVHDDQELEDQVSALMEGPGSRELSEGGLFAERFINGPEFTVLVLGMHGDPASIHVFPPVERAFNLRLPEEERFFSFDRYWELYKEESPPPGGIFYEYRPVPSPLKERLTDLARRAYHAVGGTGYGRVDIRMDKESKELFVLEVNANCGISADENQSSTGQILKWAGIPFSQLMSEMLYGALLRK